MNTKLIIIIIAVIVVLGGGFLAYKYLPENTVNIFNNNDKQTNTSLPDGSDNSAIDNNNNPDGPVITQITDNYLDVPFLENISDEDMMLLQRSDNYLSLSKLNNICERKSTAEEKNDCLATLKIRQVNILDKVEYCGQLSGSKKDTCIKTMAFKNNDLELCASIADNDVMKYCKDNLTKFKAQKDKNVLLCLDLGEAAKDQCITSVFSNETDIAYCDTDVIQNNNLTDTCQSIIYTNQAISQNNPSVCDQIPIGEYKDMCHLEAGI